MSEWPLVELGKVVDFFDSKRVPLSGMERATRQGQFPYYGASGIIDWIDDYIFDGRYLLIAEDGENLNSRKVPIAFLADGRFWVNNHAHIIRGKDGRLDEVFLEQWFAQADLGGYVTGAAQPKLTQANMKRIQLRLPPFPIQRKIAAVLSAYDDLLERNNRRIKLLEEMARRLYREWFVDFRYPGRDLELLGPPHAGIVPTGWELTTIGARFSVVLGGTPSRRRADYWSEGRVPWITSSKVNEIRVIEPSEMITDSGLRSSNARLMPRGTTLIAITGATLGQVSYLEIEASANQSVIGITDMGGIHSEYLYLTVSSQIDRMIGAATGGAQQHINKAIVESFPVLLPARELGREFARMVRPMFDQLANCLWSSRNLRATRDLLLPRLISGEIDVSDLDIAMPEPAA